MEKAVKATARKSVHKTAKQKDQRLTDEYAETARKNEQRQGDELSELEAIGRKRTAAKASRRGGSA
jgi:hypothetical protein